MARCPKCGTEGLDMIRGADGRLRLMDMNDATMHYTKCEEIIQNKPVEEVKRIDLCHHGISYNVFCDKCAQADPPSKYH